MMQQTFSEKFSTNKQEMENAAVQKQSDSPFIRKQQALSKNTHQSPKNTQEENKKISLSNNEVRQLLLKSNVQTENARRTTPETS